MTGFEMTGYGMTGGGRQGCRDEGGRLRAFVPLCEIHWRSVWLWWGCVLARYGRGPTRLALLLFLGYIVRVTVILL